MSDVLANLANQIRKSEIKPINEPVQNAMPRPERQPLVKSGPGGVLFNFGSVTTGNTLIDRYNHELQHHAEDNQLAIAKGQAQDHARAINSFVEKGEAAYQQSREEASTSVGIDSSWNKQLRGNTDQQVVEAFKKGMLDVNENQSSPAGGRHDIAGGSFSKSEIRMGNQKIVATSETDAALIEMMKGGHFDDDKES